MTQRFFSNPGPNDMPLTADVVVIGGGPTGAAALWAIERFAPGTKTVLIEQTDRLGAGSSLASLECYRTCWPSLCMAKQMERSVDVFHHADDYLGEGASQSLALHEQGYLFCAVDARGAAGLKADVEHLHGMGMAHIEYLEGDELRYRFGWLGDNLVAGKFDPTAGWLDSNALTYRFAQSAPNARILLGITDARIRVENGRVTGVSTPNGDIATSKVVIAAGAGAGVVARTAGVNLPLVLRPRQSFTTGWRHDAFPEESPMIIGAAPFPHCRPEARSGAIFGWDYGWSNKYADPAIRSPHEHDALTEPIFPANPFKDPRFPSVALMLLARQFGHDGDGFGDSRYLRSLSHNIGYYVYRDHSAAYRTNPDGTTRPYESERAIMDVHPEVDGLVLSVAHVGHGIMTSPAAGEIVASHVLGLPLPDPAFADFGLNVPWVPHDENAL